ncbi:MAG: hypothetical protein KatS3mg108_3369 [Isosphaeraceae bacterium]|nr:MAG: hypothetical protein KatS3mg108_3369 [Isosphaeraceae bacterium]
MSPARPRRWLAGLAALGVGLTLTGLPAWLYWPWYAYPSLRGDDFAFLADCRSGAEPFRSLWTPHNAHVVPLFRLATAGLARLAGSLSAVPEMLTRASLGLLIGCSLLAGHIVAWQTGRLVLGLAAIVGVGLSTVLQSAATWYSASQTLMAGLLVLAGLAAAQRAVVTQRRIWIIPAAVAAWAAPLAWSGGAAAGPTAAVYLALSRDQSLRRWAWLPLIGSGLAVLMIGAMAGGSLAEQVGSAVAEAAQPASPIRPITHTAQAVVESLVMGNLGMPTASEPIQAVVLVVGLLVVFWRARRGSEGWPNPLEAAGLVLIAVGYGMAFTLRSGFDYANLRELGWYHTLPQLGAVLFGFGWLAGRSGLSPNRPRLPALVEYLGLGGWVVLAAMVHQPRAEALRIADAPPMLPSEVRQFLIPELKYGRAIVYAELRSGRQRRALTRLQRAAEQARVLGLDRSAIRAVLGPVRVPGWPVHVTSIDALDLVRLPESGREVPAAAVAAALGPLLAPEPLPRLPWSDAGDPWPPTDWATVP